jgi:subtilisin family serine protease
MASPHVAGAAALCRGTHRGLDMDHIRSILKSTANDLGNPGKDDLYGYGLVDCNNATFWRTCG